MNSFMFFARRVTFCLTVLLAIPAISCALSFAVMSPAAAAVASSVVVKGNQRIEAETITTYLTIKPGKSYSAADVDESIKKLFDTGLFADVSIVQRGPALVVTVVENPVINSVTFVGNKKVKSNILEQVVSAKPRGTLTDARLQGDIARIKEYYSRSGRSNALVQGAAKPIAENRVDVVFTITEGDRTGVSSIVFVGNKAFSSTSLTRVISLRTTNWMSWLDKKDIYSEEKIQADEELLRRFYLSHGYADFQVLSGVATLDPAKGKYTVTYTVDEGPKYSFGDIGVDSSIQGIDSKALDGFVLTRKGRVFNADEVQKSVENLTIELSRRGYVFAQVRPRGDRDYTNNVISMTYVIDEGARAYVERIDIRGNSKTRDYVIRREFDISEGDAYNRVLIDRAQRRLNNLGYFKTVQITTEPGSAPDKVIVVVNVEDQSTGSFSISGGLSTEQGIIAEISMDEKNFLGRGQQVRVSVGGSLTTRDYQVSFTDPYFLGSRISAGFDGYDTTSQIQSYQPYNTEIIGGGVRLGLPLSDELSAQVNYKISNETISGTVACGAGFVTGCYFPNGSRLTSSAGYALTYSTIDNKTTPTEGWYFNVAQDFAGLGGDARYVRTVGEGRVYRPIMPGSDMIGMLKVAGGNVTGIGGPVSTEDDFFKGGETIRGFAPYGYGPRDVSGLALGGKNFINGTAEVSFPLPFLPPDFALRGAVFADAGTLFGADVPAPCPGCAVQDDASIRSSVGASIIWASPFGSIRADFADAITKTTYDQTQIFRLGAGAAF
jgi:outer membrane protein insertion porin family